MSVAVGLTAVYFLPVVRACRAQPTPLGLVAAGGTWCCAGEWWPQPQSRRPHHGQEGGGSGPAPEFVPCCLPSSPPPSGSFSQSLLVPLRPGCSAQFLRVRWVFLSARGREGRPR